MKEEKEKLFKSTEARNHDVHGGMLWSGIKKEGPPGDGRTFLGG